MLLHMHLELDIYLMSMTKLNMLKPSLVRRVFHCSPSVDYLSRLAHCIDKYTKLQVEKFQSDGTAHVQIDQRLENIVNRMFQRCFDDKKYKQVKREFFSCLF